MMFIIMLRKRWQNLDIFTPKMNFRHSWLKKGGFRKSSILSGHSKIDKTWVSKTNGSLMKVESIAECSPFVLKPIFCLLFEWPLKTGFTAVVFWKCKHMCVT